MMTSWNGIPALCEWKPPMIGALMFLAVEQTIELMYETLTLLQSRFYCHWEMKSLQQELFFVYVNHDQTFTI